MRKGSWPLKEVPFPMPLDGGGFHRAPIRRPVESPLAHLKPLSCHLSSDAERRWTLPGGRLFITLDSNEDSHEHLGPCHRLWNGAKRCGVYS